MKDYSRLFSTGMILMIFGTTLASVSYLNLYYVNAGFPILRNVEINTNSSVIAVPAYVFYFGTPTKVLVMITRTSEYSYVFHPIMITLLYGKQNISAAYVTPVYIDEDLGLKADHSFDIPASWDYKESGLAGVKINNPENHAVSWNVTLLFSYKKINTQNLALMIIGIIALTIGMIVSLMAYSRMRTREQLVKP